MIMVFSIYGMVWIFFIYINKKYISQSNFNRAKFHLSNKILLLRWIEFIMLSKSSSETRPLLRRIVNLQQLTLCFQPCMRMFRIEIFGSFTHSSHDLTVKPFSCPNQTLPSDLCVVPWTAMRRMKNTDKRQATTFRHTTMYYAIHALELRSSE